MKTDLGQFFEKNGRNDAFPLQTALGSSQLDVVESIPRTLGGSGRIIRKLIALFSRKNGKILFFRVPIPPPEKTPLFVKKVLSACE